MILADVGLGAADHFVVLEHQDLWLEDLRLDESQPSFRLLLDLADPILHPQPRFPEALDLGFHGIRRNRHVRHARGFPAHHEGWTDHDSRGGRYAISHNAHAYSSPKRPSISAARSRTAPSASLPQARMVISLPNSAASIIM